MRTNKNVTFSPFDRTYEFVNNTHKKFINEKGMSKNDKEAVLKIKDAFIAYLDEIKDKMNQEEHFPLITYNESRTKVTFIDERLTAYFVLMDAISKHQAQLPTVYKKRELGFGTKGWPVADNHPLFISWLTFAQTAVAAFKQAQPNSDLSAWASPERALDNYNFDEWSDAPKTLKRLIMSLKEMYSYGSYLKAVAPEKSTAAMSLAIELFEDLQKHYALKPEERDDAGFKNEFLNKLHSPEHHKLMSTHRKYWQVFVANVFIAFTGIGLVAIGASLLFRGHTFFGIPKSQELLNDVEQQSRISLTVQ